MSKPLIGITTSHYTGSQGYPNIYVPQSYPDAIARAGGLPFLIPLGLPEEVLTEMIQRLDGVLFTGGGDVSPERYGGETPSLASAIDIDRDRVELHLFENLTASGKPFLGICRGLQIINVAMGGSLYTDIGAQHPNAIRHDFQSGFKKDHLAHLMKVETSSQLGKAMGVSDLQVNSRHHQGICRLADDLQPAAYSSDGLIEGVEMVGYPYGIAVQWHPENLTEQQAAINLFRSFIEAAGAR